MAELSPSSNLDRFLKLMECKLKSFHLINSHCLKHSQGLELSLKTSPVFLPPENKVTKNDKKLNILLFLYPLMKLLQMLHLSRLLLNDQFWYKATMVFKLPVCF